MRAIPVPCNVVCGLRRMCGVCVLMLLAFASTASRADTVASLLGNFTVNQYCGLALDTDNVRVRYTVVFGQLPALRELHEADADRDGVTSQAERDDYAKRLAPTFAQQLGLVVDGRQIPLTAIHTATSLPTEQGGFSLRLDVDLAGRLPSSVGSGEHTLHFANRNYPGRFGWQEIVVEPSRGISVFATDAFSTSLTADLTEALATLPPGGPLAERAVKMSFTHGVPPSGATTIAARPGTAASAVASASAPAASANNWLAVKTRELVNMISTPQVAPTIGFLALLAAVMLGALHAFSPGHGKTIVGAYLIGSRATFRHAAFLGATVTITHTLGVFALGFATLFASRFVVPERLLPALSLLSGLLVLGMGIVLTVRRWPAARDAWSKRAPRRAATTWRVAAKQSPHGKAGHGFVMAYAGAHQAADHHHDGGHAHGVMHSHGGSTHSHLPPGAAGEAVTWKGLLALGISGGLVPCPSAMVLLLAAIALNKTAFGLALVLAFSVGLALTLIGVGLAFLYARNRIRRPVADSRLARLLPLASATFITVVGALLCYGSLASAPI
ncbi:MAG TPA: sulfite exporter TauE/SafE family protein [Casimicrobiaceae bacterium]